MKLPAPYPDVLARAAPGEIRQRLRVNTQLGTNAAGAKGFVTRILLTDPAGESGYFTLELAGSTVGTATAQERTVQTIALLLHQPRGPVTGPMTCSGGYRHFVLRDPEGRIFGGAQGYLVGQPPKPPTYHYLERSVLERIERELLGMTFPVAWNRVTALLAPAQVETDLPIRHSVYYSGGLADNTALATAPPAAYINLTDPTLADGYYSLVLIGGAKTHDWDVKGSPIERVILQYYRRTGEMTGAHNGKGGYPGYALFELDVKRAP